MLPVAHWCVHGDPNNLESLEDGRKNGNHKKATEEYINGSSLLGMV